MILTKVSLFLGALQGANVEIQGRGALQGAQEGLLCYNDYSVISSTSLLSFRTSFSIFFAVKLVFGQPFFLVFPLPERHQASYAAEHNANTHIAL